MFVIVKQITFFCKFKEIKCLINVFLFYEVLTYLMTCSIPRCTLPSLSQIHIKINSYFVGTKPKERKELFKVYVVYTNILPVIEQRLSTLR